MSLQSIFQTPQPVGTEWDILSSEGGLVQSRGRVLSYSDFETGYDGWAELFSAAMIRQPISLSTEIGAVHGDTALKLSTAAQPYVSATDAVAPNDPDSLINASAYKRMGSYRESGLISISAYVAFRSGGANALQPSTRTFGIGLDMQKQDNSSRSFPRLFYKSYFAADGSGTSRLEIQGNSGTLPVATPKASASSTNLGPGGNENKANWVYVRLTFDLDANSGLGGYYECQINSAVIDLRGFTTERGAQTPQFVANAPKTDFRGGNNAGLFVQRNTDSGTAANFPAIAFFDGVCVTIGDVRA